MKARNRIIGVDDDEADVSAPSGQDRGRKPQKSSREATREARRNVIYDNEFSSKVDLAADPVIPYMSREELQRTINARRQSMVEAAKNMQFMEAAQLRDEVIKLEERLKECLE